MGFTAGVHDSRVYKHTPLYLNPAVGIKPMLLNLICFHHTKNLKLDVQNVRISISYNLSIPRVQTEDVPVSIAT